MRKRDYGWTYDEKEDVIVGHPAKKCFCDGDGDFKPICKKCQDKESKA